LGWLGNGAECAGLSKFPLLVRLSPPKVAVLVAALTANRTIAGTQCEQGKENCLFEENR
jgi:hypothetical protein